MLNTSEIIGKTYSLYAGKTDTDEFYKKLSELGKKFLNYTHSDEEIISIIRKYSSRKRTLKNSKNRQDSIIFKILSDANTSLSKYLTDIDTHLSNLSLAEKCDSTLTTSREQYLLYMLEIEIVNKTNKNKFNSSKSKFALLPHCLHDLEKECLSYHDGADYICKHCSKNCSINSVSKILQQKKVKSYIWREADLKKIFRLAKSNGESIGVFGIACIPELVNGFRLCSKYDVPAIGVPLDANRCVRWMGDFYPNSVNEKKLLSLLN
jgi:hypothetical protein